MLTLAAHGFSLDLSPEAGALVERLRWRPPSGAWRDLLRPPQGPRAPGSPALFGLWPLLPFANRAFGGVIDDGARRFTVPLNDPATGSAIHGFGWMAAWAVETRAADHCVLIHQREGADDPYRYAASLRIALDADHVHVGLSVQNLADATLPFGLGLHPWLPAAPDTVIRFAAEGCLALGPGYRATGVSPWPDGGLYAKGLMRPTDAETAVSVVGWRGPALFETPSLGLAITIAASETLRHPVLWSPPGADFVCFEPQSHGIGAPSEAAARAVTPLQALQPGEALEGWMTLTPAELAGEG
jgi:aldose 1-epimerase